MAEQKETPLVAQYFEIQKKYHDCIVLLRVGDFYEALGESAQKLSDTLGILLTARAGANNTRIKLSGFPCTSIEDYLKRLVKAGHKVAIVEEVKDSKQLDVTNKGEL